MQRATSSFGKSPLRHILLAEIPNVYAKIIGSYITEVCKFRTFSVQIASRWYRTSAKESLLEIVDQIAVCLNSEAIGAIPGST